MWFDSVHDGMFSDIMRIVVVLTFIWRNYSVVNNISLTEAGSPTSEGSGCTLATSPGKQKAEKTPRVRTVLSDKQLKILKAVYSQNPKPDSLMKEHLCEVTGLSPRVIRVWFQNKRCKDKKKILQDQAIEESAQLQSGMVRDILIQLNVVSYNN